ncbi:MerR family DNA-binding transcriptional regulator, partial [Enterococcus lactis]
MDFSITQLAKQYSLNVETLRYYERIGLIPEVPRRA